MENVLINEKSANASHLYMIRFIQLVYLLIYASAGNIRTKNARNIIHVKNLIFAVNLVFCWEDKVIER